MSLQHSLCFLTGAIPDLKSSSGTTVQGSLDNTDDESPEGNSRLHPNEQGNSRGRAEESDGSEDLDSSSQSDSKEDCDPKEAKILSGPTPSIHQDLHDHVPSEGLGDPAPNLEAIMDLQTSVDVLVVELEVATIVEGLEGAQKRSVCLEENEDVLGVGRDTREKEAKDAPTVELSRGVQGVDGLEGEYRVAKLDGREEVQELEEGKGVWSRPWSTLVQEMAGAIEVPTLEGAQGVEGLHGAKEVKEMEGSKRVDKEWALLEGGEPEVEKSEAGQGMKELEG